MPGAKRSCTFSMNFRFPSSREIVVLSALKEPALMFGPPVASVGAKGSDPHKGRHWGRL